MNSARKKILLLIPSLTAGGAERFFCLLLRHLDRKRFEPHLALLQARGEYIEEVPDDVVVHDLSASRARYSLWRLVRLIWKLRPHAVLSTLANTNIAVTLVRPALPPSTKVLLSEATSPSACIEAEEAHPELWKWLYRRFYKWADRVICLSDAVVDEMAERFKVPRQKLLRIYYPVDVKRVRELAEVGGNPFLGPGPHLVAAGRLCWAKGFDVLLQAMPAVVHQYAHARLTILGEGSLRAELTEQAQKLGLLDVVSFPGFQRNPWCYFRHADLFVLSSRFEGLGYVLLEALAVGTPVVATDCSAAIREAGVYCNGIVVVPPEDPAALSSAIVSACGKSNGSRTQDELSNFDLESVVNAYSSLLWD